MTKQLLIGLAATCLVLGACSSDDDPVDATPECTTEADCKTGEICDNGTCKTDTTPECTTEADCEDGEICDNGTCKPDTSSACDPACSGTKPICDEESGECVACTADEGCSGDQVCDTTVAGGECVECIADEDCSGAQFCEAKQCVTCNDANKGCSGDTPVCDVPANNDDGQCVGCLASADCSEDAPVCNTSKKECVVCTATEGCSGEEPVCDVAAGEGAGLCVVCTVDGTGCTGETKVCAINGTDRECVVCTTADDNKGCSGETPICDDTEEEAGLCVECTTADHCGEYEVCEDSICVLPTVAKQILDVRNAADETSIDLEVLGVVVTYIRPASDEEPAGFFVQAGPTGPALLVVMPEVALDPAPEVGQTVSFVVTGKNTSGQATLVISLEDDSWDVAEEDPVDVTEWIQNLGEAKDLITALDSYEAELISISGTIVGDFGDSGNEMVSAMITTEGMDSSNEGLKLRLPASLNDELGLSVGCTFTLVGPMWRSGDEAQPSAYAKSDLTDITCPAPTMVSASATDATTVEVTFDRFLDPDSVETDGSQFTITYGDEDDELVVSNAEVSGKTVTLTTAAQTEETEYTITVAEDAVKGLHGGVVVSPTTPVTFEGFVAPDEP